MDKYEELKKAVEEYFKDLESGGYNTNSHRKCIARLIGYDKY